MPETSEPELPQPEAHVAEPCNNLDDPFVAAPIVASNTAPEWRSTLSQIFFGSDGLRAGWALLIYLGLPEFQIRLSPLESILIALSVNNGAYLGEIIRGGLQSVPKGQLEAAASIGLGRRATLQEIMVPQALRSIIPALTNQFILAILASSLGSIIGTPELTQQVLFIDSRFYRTIELLTFLTLAYALLTQVVARLSRMLLRRVDRAYAR